MPTTPARLAELRASREHLENTLLGLRPYSPANRAQARGLLRAWMRKNDEILSRFHAGLDDDLEQAIFVL